LKLVYLIGFAIGIYCDARTYDRQIVNVIFLRFLIPHQVWFRLISTWFLYQGGHIPFCIMSPF